MKRLCYFLVLCASFWWLEYASAQYRGDVPLGDTLYFHFNTLDASGEPVGLGGTPAIEVWEENNSTAITSGASIDDDYQTLTGMHEVTIVATGANGYEAGKWYTIAVGGTSPTADSVSIDNRVIGTFRIVEAENVAGTPAADITYVDGSAASTSIATAADIAQAVWEYVIGTEPTAVPPTAGTTEVLDMLKYVYYYGGGFNKVNSDLTSGEGEMQYYDSGGTKRFERDVTKAGTVTTKDEVRAND